MSVEAVDNVAELVRGSCTGTLCPLAGCEGGGGEDGGDEAEDNVDGGGGAAAFGGWSLCVGWGCAFERATGGDLKGGVRGGKFWI